MGAAMHRVRSVFVGACLAMHVSGQPPQDGTFLSRSQQQDGSWAAAAFGGKAEADLRVNAWILLVYLADGSTVRQGPFRKQVAGSLAWLRSKQDEKGRFLLRADPEWLLDHAMATYAVAEAMRLGARFDAKELDCVTRGVTALCQEVAAMRPAPSCELLLWCRIVEGSFRVALEPAPAHKDDVAQPPDALRTLAEDLAKAVARLAPVAPAAPRERAAALLLEDLGASPPSRDEVASVEWPDNALEDPLLTLYLFLVAWRQGGPALDEVRKHVQEGVIKTQVRVRERQDTYGSWDPVGAFGAKNGRLGISAAASLSLCVYYRYSRLSVVSQ